MCSSITGYAVNVKGLLRDVWLFVPDREEGSFPFFSTEKKKKKAYLRALTEQVSFVMGEREELSREFSEFLHTGSKKAAFL